MTKAAFSIAWAALGLGAGGLLGCSDDKDPSASGGAGSGGTGGAAACLGDPPVTPNKVCKDIPSQKKGDAAFTVSSPDFADCGEIPKANTCDGGDFGSGASPKFTWTTAPAGTKSFAVVFKDISLSNDVATERFGYHSVIWDIPSTVTELPAKLGGG